MHVDAVSIGLVTDPFAVEIIPIRMDESALAVRLVRVPVPLVLATVLPDLDAAAVALTLIIPLTLVDCFIL